MVGSIISHYRKAGKLSTRGMGEVYRATDRKLDLEEMIKATTNG